MSLLRLVMFAPVLFGSFLFTRGCFCFKADPAIKLSGGSPSQKPGTCTTACLLSCPAGCGESRKMARTIMAWDSINLIAAQASKAKRGIYSLHSIGRQMSSLFWGSRVSAQVAQMLQLQRSSLPTPCLELLLLNTIVWDIPLVSWGQLSWLWPLPASCPPTAFSMGMGRVGERGDHNAVQALLSNTQKHWCVKCTVLVTDPKQSTAQAAMKITPASTHTWKINIKLYRFFFPQKMN